MSRAMRRSLFHGVVLLGAIAACLLPLRADDKPADKYTETGTVLSTADKHGHFYQVSTDSRIYLLLCDKVKSIQFGPPECKVGDKAIATGDTVHFRIDGDWAYMPPATKGKPEAKPEATASESEGMEEKLRILTTELKVIPALPAPAANAASGAASPASASPTTEKGANPASERGVVIGSGMQVNGQHGVGWSTVPTSAAAVPVPRPMSPGITTASPTTPVIATAPVMAVPVTGGAPVMVVPTGPTTGGVVTGVPVTGGAPVTAIATAPVMGIPVAGPPVGGAPMGAAPPAGSPMMIGGRAAPQWVHVLRIQTAGKVYQLEGSTKPGKLANKEIALGETLTLRTDKKEKHAYLSTDPYDPAAEQEYKILSVTPVAGAPAEPKPTSESKSN